MSDDNPASFSEKQAGQFDARWQKVAALKDALNLVTQLVLSALPEDARVLCVGAGTGAELLHLAGAFPGWRFTVVEPAPAMMARCRAAAEEHGISARCAFHEGYLDSLPEGAPHDGATCLLVAHFLPASGQRSLLQQLAQHLKPGGTLVQAALSADSAEDLREDWARMLRLAAVPAPVQERMLSFRDVHLLPSEEVAAMAVISGFTEPVAVLQTLLIRAWKAQRR